jgi:hypothetical protein
MKGCAATAFTGCPTSTSKRFNEALLHGLMGQGTPYPELRHGRDLSHGRELLLQTYRQGVLRSFTTPAEDNTAQ